MAKSSIHIQGGSGGSVTHNSRESFSYSVVFKDENNELWNDSKDAFKIYRDELNVRSQAYTERTGQKLQKNALTQLSAVINLEQHHTLKDLESIKKHLEATFDTKVFQMSIHRDEGKLINKEDENIKLVSGEDFFLNAKDNKLYFDKQFKKEIDMKEWNIEKNYHAHIEMMGLDTQGNGIKRNYMNIRTLSNIQTFVAKELDMQRGNQSVIINENGELERDFSKRKKRQDTHPFKKSKKIENDAYLKASKELLATKEQLEALKVENEALKEEKTILKKENTSLKSQNTKNKKEIEKLKVDNEALKYSKKELENQIKDLSKNLRESLKDLGAVRADYAQLEQLNKDLKEELKNERLNQEKVIKSYEDLEKSLREELTKKDEKIDNLAAENEDLKTEIEALKYQLDLKEKRSQAYFGLNQELKSEINVLKEQINTLQEQKEDLEEKVASRANTKDFDFEALQTRTLALKERAEAQSDRSSFNKIKEVQQESKIAEKKELEQSNEAEEPIENRSVRKNR